jgi:hypothetical protein
MVQARNCRSNKTIGVGAEVEEVKMQNWARPRTSDEVFKILDSVITEVVEECMAISTAAFASSMG